MRHRKLTRRIGRTTAHRQATLRNMAIALFTHERIETTLGKARALRPMAEKLITLGKRGDLHARRLAARDVRDHAALQKLFSTLSERYKERPGGYTRILKLGNRRGDNAPRAFVELVDAELNKSAEA